MSVAYNSARASSLMPGHEASALPRAECHTILAPHLQNASAAYVLVRQASPSQERKGLVSCLYASCSSAYATLMDMLQRPSTYSVYTGDNPNKLMNVQI